MSSSTTWAAGDMRVTVVVNNFNYERFLSTAIESALAQTHPDVEVVVVDDGSTDGSRAVMAAFAPRIRVVLKDNGGQTSALNLGMEVAGGDVVIFLDADDALAPAAAQRAAELLADPAVVKAHWPLLEIDATGTELGRRHPAVPLPAGDLREALIEGGPEACVFPPTSGNAFSAGFLRGVFPLPDVPTSIGSASADAHLSMLAALSGRVARWEEPLGFYRVHGANSFAAKTLPERLRHNVAHLEQRFEALAEQLRREGVPADPPCWRAQSWAHRLDATRAALDRLL